jgi:hypothetical protein
MPTSFTAEGIQINFTATRISFDAESFIATCGGVDPATPKETPPETPLASASPSELFSGSSGVSESGQGVSAPVPSGPAFPGSSGLHPATAPRTPGETLTETAKPTPAATPPGTSAETRSGEPTGGLSDGAIVGVAVGGFAVGAVVAGVIVFVVVKRRGARPQAYSQLTSGPSRVEGGE